jgi:hypothetical protein
MRRISMATRDELVAAIAGRYSQAERSRILDEFTAISGFHRKHAMRPLVPVLVEAVQRHGHLRLDPAVRISLLAMSAAAIDRALRDVMPGRWVRLQ